MRVHAPMPPAREAGRQRRTGCVVPVRGRGPSGDERRRGPARVHERGGVGGSGPRRADLPEPEYGR